jgi:adenylate cyclase
MAGIRPTRLARPTGFVLLLTLCTALAVYLASALGWLQNMELGAYDRQVRWLSDEDLPDPEVVLVWISEIDIGRYGHPLPDAVLAELLEKLLSHDPSAIGLDVYRDKPVPPGSARLRELMTANHNVVIVEKFPDQNEQWVPPPDYMPPEQVGFSDTPLDTDGVVRRMFLMMWDEEGHASLGFALQLALKHLFKEGVTLTAAPENPDHVRLGRSTLAPLDRDFGSYVSLDADGYQLMLDQRMPGGRFRHVPLREVLNDVAPRDVFEGKVVIVATGSPSVKDHFNTSLDPTVFGGTLHAAAVDQLLRHARGVNRPMSSISLAEALSWIAFWCLLGSLAGNLVRSPFLGAGVAVTGLGSVAMVSYLALGQDIWLPLTAPSAGFIASLTLGFAVRSRQEKQEKEQMLQLFGRFVSKRIVSEVWDRREEFMDGERPRPQRAPITVMACDLKGFTSASAAVSPDQVMDWVGRFMEVMAELVESHGGVVGDFTGDGLMAWFGVPLVRTDPEEIKADATAAVRCAIRMSRALKELCRDWEAAGLPTARMRIGIASGDAVVGAYGSRYRVKYASVGTTVNTAARLEAHDKEGFDRQGSGNRILVSGSTWDLLEGNIEGRNLGPTWLQGLPEPIRIYRIVEEQDERDEDSDVGGSVVPLSRGHGGGV